MSMRTDIQIADILSVAISQRVCSEVISGYPKKSKQNFDPASTIDSFWKNTCNTYFYDSLLLTANLLNKDPRTISMFNWSEFKKDNFEWLNQQVKSFEKLGLRTVRNQIVGHVDASNPVNHIPRQRRTGIIHEALIENLKKIQEELVLKFDEFTRKNGNPFSHADFFEGKNARTEIELAIGLAKPQLTSLPVI